MVLRSALALMCSLAIGACVTPELYRARAPLGAQQTTLSPKTAGPRIVSAHVTHIAAGDADELLLVFSTEVDPSTLEAGAFVVVLQNGDLVYPSRALLDPADEVDENRSVTLVGDFGEPAKATPTAVRVLGNVYAEDGRSLFDLDADVRAFEVADELVWLEVVEPAEHRCVGARQVVRTYWSDNLRGVEAADLQRVRVSFTDGTEVAPIAFDDHADLQGDTTVADDNVLDLCLGRNAPVSNVFVPEGTFTDRAGHGCAATTRAASARG